MFSVQLHHIQRDIINSLAHSSPLRFSELQPKRVPNNTFSYHLKKLIETGYIISTVEGYIPTRKAQKSLPYTDTLERRTKRPLPLTFTYITNEQNEVLLLKRYARPFKDWFGLPSGLIHNNETIDQAAQRELFEKTGILAQSSELFSHGVLSFRYLESGSNDTFIHAIGFIYSYKYTGDPEVLIERGSKYGVLSWSQLDHIDVFPEVYEIAQIVAQGEFIVRSVDFEEPLLN